jgi:predicted DNA-binding transcriptional regulator AlpA
MVPKRTLNSKRETLSAAELALELQTSAQHIYELAAQGMLPHFRVSGALRFDRSLIADWRKRNTITSVHTDHTASAWT